MSDKKEEQRASFWLTLPGCITALGGFVTAVVGSYVALVVAGVIPAPFAPTPTSPPPMIAPLPDPVVTKPPSTSVNDSVSFVATLPSTSTVPPLAPVIAPTLTQAPQSVCDQYKTIPLQLYWNEERQDNITVAGAASINGATSAGYRLVGTEGRVFQNPQDGTIPLVLYYEGYTSFDNFTVTSEGISQALAAGYWRVSDAVEGYVLRAQLPGTIPLNLYYHAQRGDNFTTASQGGQNDAQAWNYQFIRTEGYVCP